MLLDLLHHENVLIMLTNLQQKPTSKRVIKETADTTDDLIGYKIANTITKVSKTSEQNSSMEWKWNINSINSI